MTSRMPNPYPGLRPFDTEEDYLFFGREEQTADLLELLRSNRFLAVVGTSGSGKSSLVRAGLIPGLVKGSLDGANTRWEIAVARPGGNPLRRLAAGLCEAGLFDSSDVESVPRVVATLRRSTRGLIEAVRQSGRAADSKFLLVVDQFEELFRYASDDVEAGDASRAFVNLILEGAAQAELPIYVVVTMRSDYLGDCARIPGLAEAINSGEYLVPRLGRDQVRRAIEGPARVGGAGVTKRFVQRLLGDLGDDSDQLPVLQHALMRAWDARGDEEDLDLDHYGAIGGLSHALSQHADEVYDGLASDELRSTAERTFKTLTVTESGERGVRRPTRVTRLEAVTRAERTQVEAVVEAFRAPGVSFLMPGEATPLADDPVIDISHESLMRVWTRLRTWVGEEAQSAAIYRRLSESAALWREDRAGLYRHPDLEVAQSWRREARPNPSWASLYAPGYENAIAFLTESQENADAEELERERARERELAQARELAETKSREAEAVARTARNFRRFAIGLAVLAVATLALAIQALLLWRDAEESRKLVSESEETARHEQGVAWFEQAQRLRAEERHFAAELLAARTLGFEGVDTIEDELGGTGDQRIDRSLLRPDSEEADSVRAFLSASMLDEPLYRSPQVAPPNARCVCWTPDGKLVVGTTSGRVALYDPERGEREGEFAAHDTEVSFVGPTSDGSAVVTTTVRADTIRCHDLSTGNERWSVAGRGRSSHAALSSDRSLLVVAGSTGVVRVDTTNGAVLGESDGGATGVAFSPDGERYAALHSDGWLRVRTREGTLVASAIHGAGVTRGLAFSPDGRRIITGALNSSATIEPAKVWEVSNDGELRVVDEWDVPHSEARSSSWFGLSRIVAARPSGEDVAVFGGSGGRLQIRRIADGTPVGVLDAHGRLIVDLAVDPTGRRLISVAPGEPMRLWDLVELREISKLGDVEIARSVDHTRDGRFVASAHANGEIRVLHSRTGAVIANHRTDVALDLIRFSPDGTRLAAGGRRGIRVFDVTDSILTQPDPLPGETVSPAEFSERARIEGLRFAWSPDGDKLAYNGTSFGVFIWDAESGVSRLVVDSSSGRYVGLAFTPDGKQLVVSSLAKTELFEIGGTKTAEWAEIGSNAGLVFQPGGDLIASVARDHLAIWRRADPPVVVGRLDHSGAEYDTRLEFSPDGRFLAVSGGDRLVRVYDVHRLTLLALLEGHAGNTLDASFAPDGRTLATTSLDNTVRYWKLGHHVDRDSLVVGGVRHRKIQFLDDSTLVAFGAESKVAIVDRRLGTVRRVLDGAPYQSGIRCAAGPATEFGGPFISLSAQSHTALWDVASGEMIRRFANDSSYNTRATFGPESRWLAVLRGPRLDHFDISTRRLRKIGSGVDLVDIAATSAGELLALGIDGRVRVIDPTTGEEREVFGSVLSETSRNVAHSPREFHLSRDGSTLAIQLPRSVSILNMREKRETARFDVVGPGAQFFDLAINEDGSRLAVCGGGVARLWSSSGEKIREYSRPDFDDDFVPYGVDFSPDGRWLAGDSFGSTIALWWVEPEERRRDRLSHLLENFALDGRRIVPQTVSKVLYADPPVRSRAPERDPVAEMENLVLAGGFDAAVSGTSRLSPELRSRISPAIADAIFHRAGVLSRNGRTDEVVRIVSEAQELVGNESEQWYLLEQRTAEAICRGGRLAEGIDRFDDAIGRAMGAGLDSIARRLARASVSVLLDLEDVDGAKDAFEKLLALPNFVDEGRRANEIQRHARLVVRQATRDSETESTKTDRALAAVFVDVALEAARQTPRLDTLPELSTLVERANAGREPVELVSSSSSWRVSPVDTTVGADWNASTFDDSAWPSVNPPILFSTTSERPELRSPETTLFARGRFQVSPGGLPEGYGLAIQSKCLPGARVFLNGVELFRHGLPEGEIDATTRALDGAHGHAWPRRADARLAEPLRKGENVVAIELHRNDGSALFSLEVVARVTPASYLAAADRSRALEVVSDVFPASVLERLGPRLRFVFADDPGSLGDAGDAGDAQAWLERARVQRVLGRSERARGAYSQAVEAAVVEGDADTEAIARGEMEALGLRLPKSP